MENPILPQDPESVERRQNRILAPVALLSGFAILIAGLNAVKIADEKLSQPERKIACTTVTTLPGDGALAVIKKGLERIEDTTGEKPTNHGQELVVTATELGPLRPGDQVDVCVRYPGGIGGVVLGNYATAKLVTGDKPG